MDALPVLATDLVTQLDAMYPEQCPDPSDSERDIWMKVGARRLVRGLLARQQELLEAQLTETR